MKGKHIMIRSEKYMLLTSPYKAVKVARRCFQKLESEELDDNFKNPKKRFRSASGGGKKKALEVREELFQWFIVVRTSLIKGKIT